MLHPVWRSGSIRTWIGIGMVVALSPLLVSGITGYLILHRDVIPHLQKTSSRQHDQIVPTQHLRQLIRSSATPVEGFAENGNAAQVRTYKAAQVEIAEAFAVLQPRMQKDPLLAGLFHKAHKDWIDADSLASDVVERRRPADSRLLATA